MQAFLRAEKRLVKSPISDTQHRGGYRCGHFDVAWLCGLHALQQSGHVKAFGSWLWVIAKLCPLFQLVAGRYIHGKWQDKLLLPL